MACLPNSSECEWSEIKYFVEYYNKNKNRTFEHKCCLDIENRNSSEPEVLCIDSKEQCLVEAPDFSGKTSLQGPIHAFFFLVSPNENPGQHLRILAQIAGRVDDENFLKDWLVATDEQELKEILLRDERFLSLRISSNTPSSVLIGRSLREIRMPEGSLVALIRRKGETIIPRGLTVLQEGDRLTIIGDAYGIEELNNEFS